VNIDEAVAVRYAGIRSELRNLENEIPLISSDGHFENINGLEVIKWKK